MSQDQRPPYEHPIFFPAHYVLEGANTLNLTSYCGRYTIRHLIGQGRKSLIYAFEAHFEDTPYALKIIGRWNVSDTEYDKAARHEANIHWLLSSHRNVCTMYGLLQVFPHGFLMMDICKKNLYGLIQSRSKLRSEHPVRSKLSRRKFQFCCNKY